jgi:hypothetical protein
MRRNWDTIRVLLIALDLTISSERSREIIECVRKDSGEECIDKHLLFMAGSGWVEFDFEIDSCLLTYEGSELLALVKDNDIWSRFRRSFDREDYLFSVSTDLLITGLKAFNLEKQERKCLTTS